MDRQTVLEWNVYLARKYGMFHDQPKFRLTWTNDHLETRKVLFGEYSDTPETRKVQKYAYCLDRWLLEELVVNCNIPAEILDQKIISYEPRLLFEDPVTREYREPNLPELDQACHYAVYKTLKGHAPTEEAMRDKEREQKKRVRSFFREQLDEAIPDTPHALVHGHGIVVPANYKRGE